MGTYLGFDACKKKMQKTKQTKNKFSKIPGAYQGNNSQHYKAQSVRPDV